MIRQQYQNTTPKRVALYVRGSQLKPLRELHTLLPLVDRCTGYFFEHGFSVSHHLHYTEVQVGSATSYRPALARLGEYVRQSCVTVLVVSSLDRIP
jgi:DNA invertase Pin-like site-specific DNA recombinase